MSDAHVVIGKDMAEKSPDKFISFQSSLFYPVAISSVPVGKGNLTIFNTFYTLIRDFS